MAPIAHREVAVTVSDRELLEYTRAVADLDIAENRLGQPDVQRVLREAILNAYSEIEAVVSSVKTLATQTNGAARDPEYYLIKGTRFHELPYSPEKDVRGSFVVGLSSFWGDPALGNYHEPDSNFAYRHIKARPLAENEPVSLLNSTREGFPHTDSAFKRDPEPLFALFMVRAAADGGDSVVWNVRSLVDWIGAQPHGQDVIDTMAHAELPFVGSILEPDRVIHAPVLLDSSGERMRYKRDAIEDAAKALGREVTAQETMVMDMIDAACEVPDLTVRFRLGNGDAVFLDNQRTLHSRDPFKDSGRHVLKTTMVIH